MSQNFHEQYVAGDDKLTVSSNRSFGLLVGAILCVFGSARCYLHSAATLEYIIISGGISLIVCGWLLPQVLTPLNNYWFKFGKLLQAVMTPIIMFILYFGLFVPFGLLMKLFYYNPLQAKLKAEQPTYWQVKQRSELAEPMKYQF